ncbi:MAG: hypothetical protein LBR44_01280 [Clostridiales Family XIII bacterium]|jgi:hypothetical protein|nr:hypothetical protein [Clostridiales Family XIII bacterium]
MENKQKHKSFWRVFWGVFCVFAAAVIILNQFGYVEVFGWGAGSLLFLFLMAVILIACVPRRLWFGIFFPLTVIGYYVYKGLGLDTSRISAWALFFVALFLSIGFSILFHRPQKHRWAQMPPGGQAAQCAGGDDFERVINDPDGSEFYAKTEFGSAVKYINTDNLVRGYLEVKCGVMKVFFDNARITPEQGQAEIEVHVSAGAMELYIPRTWAVVNELTNRVSSIEEKGAQEHVPDAPRLVLTGTVDISGFTVIYV